MSNVKKLMILAAIAALLLSICLVSSACVSRSAKNVQADTLVVNTTELCKDVIGYDGPTPLKITIVKGVVAKVEALPNTETPRFFDQVLESGLLKAVVGKKVSEAAKMPLDAVSGATYTSNGVKKSLKARLEAYQRQLKK